MAKRLDITLDEKGVKENLVSILEDMQRIRNEAVNVEDVTDEHKDEYLHLAHRLASCVRALANEQTVERMDRLGKELVGNNDLMSYDPLQREYWKRKNNRFVKNLDDLASELLGEGFSSHEQEHHILQTVKYFGAVDEKEDEQLKILDSIKPFTGPVLRNDGFLRRMFARFFGCSFNIETADHLTAKIKGKQHNLQGMLDEARRRGFIDIRYEMYAGDYAQEKENLPNANITKIIKPADRGKFRKKRAMKGDFVELEFKVNSEKESVDRNNYFSYFSDIAGEKIPEKEELNLIWSTQNHNQFGKKFSTYLGRKFKEIGEPEINRENQAVVYSRAQKVDGMNKQSFLVCYANKRYVVSRISRKALDNKEIVRMTEKADNEESLKDLLVRLKRDSSYAHILYVRDGEKVAEFG